MHSAVYGTRTKVHHRYPDLSDKQTGWLEAHDCIPEIVQDEPTPGVKRLDNTDVMEIGR